MTSIRLSGVNVNFRDVHILRNISFEIEDQSYCVIVGPSGCGKTLILRVIAGLTKSDSGEVYFDGRLMNDVPPSERNIAMAFQTYALYPSLTVEENWRFPLYAENITDQAARERIGEVAELLNMGPLLKRFPNELSGGQQQRVALGRALVRRPAVFLLDEPMGNLDAKLRVELRAQLKKILIDLGITTVHVTHDQVEAQSLGDQIVVMDLGSVQQTGTPEEIYENPVNQYVAEFIGVPRMNFFNGYLQEEDSQLVFQHPDFRLELPEIKKVALKQAQAGEQVILGIRPEAIQIKTEAKNGSIPGTVYVTEPQSNELIIEVQLASQTHLKLRSDWRALGFEPEINQAVYIAMDTQQAYLFEPETGKRLV